jgi:mRNA guanylyltransferase
MYITADESRAETVYLITRSNEYYLIPHMHFPREENVAEFHSESLIDGELITYEDDTEKPRYLIFDCLALDRKSHAHRPLDKRLGVSIVNHCSSINATRLTTVFAGETP